MSGIFTITQYGQNPLVMDWFQLQDPFTQNFPVNVQNNWSGSLWFVASLNNPPAWYSNYSGISGTAALVTLTNGTFNMSWQVSVSGQIDKSGPNTDNLSLTVVAYSSGFYSGVIASGTITFSNLLFNRYSGVIKLLGETYNNDQPNFTTASINGAGSFVSGQNMSYAASYLLSGWESDIGPLWNITVGSGENTITLTWVTAPENPTWYYIWRWSGSTDLPAQTNISGLNAIDLIAIVSGSNSAYTDTNAAVLQSGVYRTRRFVGTIFNFNLDASQYVSPLYSLSYSTGTTQLNKNFYLKKNVSGTTLIGPWFIEWHDKLGGTGQNAGLLLSTNPNSFTSGIVIVPYGPGVLAPEPTGKWIRFCMFVSGSALSTSGYIWMQKLEALGNGGTLNVDDVFVVANS